MIISLCVFELFFASSICLKMLLFNSNENWLDFAFYNLHFKEDFYFLLFYTVVEK